ncbi:hypothetical protein MMC13_008067 [Lambiella insularis]|nr:hypothetical protein [Lambiella insularis]
MDLVYKSARIVIIVLEDIEYSADEAAYILDLKIAAANNEASKDGFNIEENRVLMRVFEKLNGARWFKRAWCSQEYILGNDCIFLIPYSETSIRLTVTELRLIYTKALSTLFDGDDARRLEIVSLDLLARNSSWSGNSHSDLKKALTATFRRMSELESSLWTDKVSLCLNITRTSLYYTGRVTDLDEYSYVMTLLALAAGDATVLCATGEPLKDIYQDSRQSWLRSSQYSETASFSVLESQQWKLPEDRYMSDIKPDHVTSDMVFMTSPLKTSSEESRLRACLYMADVLEDNPHLTNGRGAMFSNFLGHHHDREFIYWSSIVFCLACGLDCGKDWMSKFLDTIDPDGLLSRNDFETDLLLNKGSYALFRSKRGFVLDGLKAVGGMGAFAVVGPVLTLSIKLILDCPASVPGRDYLVGKMARLTGMDKEDDSPEAEGKSHPYLSEAALRAVDATNPTEPAPSWLMYANFCIQCLYSVAVAGEEAFTINLGRDNTKAIAIALGNPPPMGRLILAVPAALTHSPYSGLRRLWWLQEVDDGSVKTYRILRKSHIFGFDDILPDGKKTISKPNVRIIPSGQPSQKLVDYEASAAESATWRPRGYSLKRNLQKLKSVLGATGEEPTGFVARKDLLDFTKTYLPKTYAISQKPSVLS